MLIGIVMQLKVAKPPRLAPKNLLVSIHSSCDIKHFIAYPRGERAKHIATLEGCPEVPPER